MAIRRRPVDLGTERARDLIIRAGKEVRAARTDRALRLEDVGRAAGLSASVVSRIERGLNPRVTVIDLARLHAVVGLEVSVRSFPGGQPIRDGAQVALLEDVRSILHPSLGWSTEVPLPIPGDQRAWDGLVQGPRWRYGVEAETAPHDSQALLRRLHLKQRDSNVDGVILVVRPTDQTRRFLASAGEVLRAAFPVGGPAALACLARGEDPGGNAMIVIQPRRRHRA